MKVFKSLKTKHPKKSWWNPIHPHRPNCTKLRDNSREKPSPYNGKLARDIAEIKIDVRSRDDIPLILLGLQHIYCTDGLREQVFGIIKEMLPTQVVDGQVKPVSAELGSPGMNQWTILVLGCLRLCLNAAMTASTNWRTSTGPCGLCWALPTGMKKHFPCKH